MALIACPDCGNQVSDQAGSCPFCGCPVAERVAQMRREEEERIAAVAAQKKREEMRRTLLIVAGIFLIFVIYNASNSGQSGAAKNLYEMDGQTQSLTPGINTFSANSGKLMFTYSCKINTGKSASVQLVLEDITTSKIVWQKSIACSATGSPSSSEALVVKADRYDIGANVHGDAAWTMKITQP